MATWFPIKSGFSAGEVGDRFTMRQDLDFYKEAVKQMINYMPTKQGTAERIPGTRFVQEITTPEAAGVDKNTRLWAFEDNQDRQVVLQVLDGSLTVYTDIDTSAFLQSEAFTRSMVGEARANVLLNPSFIDGDANWLYSGDIVVGTPPPPAAKAVYNYRLLSTDFLTESGISKCRTIIRSVKNDVEDWPRAFVSVSQDVNVVTPTNVLTIQAKATVQCQASWLIPGKEIPENMHSYRVVVTNGVFYYATPEKFSQNVQGSYVNADILANVDMPTDFTGPLTVSIEFIMKASGTGEQWTSYDSEFRVDSLLVLVETDVVVGAQTVVVNDPPDVLIPDFTYYTAQELNELQFVQSPYPPLKELVIVHPNHPPARLFYDTLGGTFAVETIPFTVTDPKAPGTPGLYYWPPSWADGQYPGSCTAYQGRLILGGGGLNSEDVIGSANGLWDSLFNIDGLETEVLPDDAIKFTTTFRSPIAWVAGGKDLLIGAADLEYVVTSASGLLRSGDIDARIQTTQGSSPVQPVPMGDEVLFPSEAGFKLRALKYQRENLGFVAEDKTLLNPFIVSVGIRRMVRIRNPHQMIIIVLNNGQAAIFHYEPTVGLNGWSRLVTSGSYIDVTVAQDAQGHDVPLFAVQRQVSGAKRLYIESMPYWTQSSTWNYMDCWTLFDNTTASNVFTGLGHLEGQFLDVMGDGAYIGQFRVTAGAVTLVDGNGMPIILTTAGIGLPKWAVIETLPAVVDITSTGGAGAQKRYSNIGIRLRYSRPPLINGVRPPDKASNTTMDQGEPLVPLQDVDITNLGYSIYGTIVIAEYLPIRSEIVGIYGKLASNKL